MQSGKRWKFFHKKLEKKSLIQKAGKTHLCIRFCPDNATEWIRITIFNTNTIEPIKYVEGVYRIYSPCES